MQEITHPIVVEDDLGEWEPQNLSGDNTCEVRVHTDGAVMWHREGCVYGAKVGALAIGVVTGVPYSAFLNALAHEQRHQGRTVLFCGGCLVYRPSDADAPQQN